MKVPYVEDLANHSSPESCGWCSNGLAEALTDSGGKRRHVSRLLSSEITFTRVLTLCTEGEGHVDSSVICELLKDPAESKNLACVDASHAIVANQEVREKPYTEELEWGNPANKNLLVHRRASKFGAREEHEKRTRVLGVSKKV